MEQSQHKNVHMQVSQPNGPVMQKSVILKVFLKVSALIMDPV